MTNELDHYRVLGVRRDADGAQIRAAYVRLIKAHHPDIQPRKDLRPERLSLLQQAYRCLRDAERRAAHDLVLVTQAEERARRMRRKLRTSSRSLRSDPRAYGSRPANHWRPALAITAGGTLILTLAACLLA